MLVRPGKGFSGRTQRNNSGTFARSLINVALHAIVVAFIDARDKVRVILNGWVLFCYHRFAAINKGLHAAVRYKAVIRADTELTAVHSLARDDAFRSQVNITILANNHW